NAKVIRPGGLREANVMMIFLPMLIGINTS
ncbi:MAG: hypothetical protein ACI9XU_001832, partial [Arenicella sp.]